MQKGAWRDELWTRSLRISLSKSDLMKFFNISHTWHLLCKNIPMARACFPVVSVQKWAVPPPADTVRFLPVLALSKIPNLKASQHVLDPHKHTVASIRNLVSQEELRTPQPLPKPKRDSAWMAANCSRSSKFSALEKSAALQPCGFHMFNLYKHVFYTLYKQPYIFLFCLPTTWPTTDVSTSIPPRPKTPLRSLHSAWISLRERSLSKSCSRVRSSCTKSTGFELSCNGRSRDGRLRDAFQLQLGFFEKSLHQNRTWIWKTVEEVKSTFFQISSSEHLFHKLQAPIQGQRGVEKAKTMCNCSVDIEKIASRTQSRNKVVHSFTDNHSVKHS